MEDIDKELESFLGGDSQASPSQPQREVDTRSLDSEIDDFLGGVKLSDPVLDEPIPSRLSGENPEMAANDQVLDLDDRLKLSFGNEQGKIDYLKTKYEDATINKRGDFVVKKDGKWNRVDPEGYGQKDAWQVTKEVLADAADIAGDVGIAAGAIAGGAVGSVVPAAGTVAGGVIGAGASEYLRSSLGRLVGTYTAEPEQQLKDVAFESMLQLAGVKFIPGVKMGVGAIASGLDKVIPKASTKLAMFYGSLNAGQDAMKTLVEQGGRVTAKMKSTAKATGSDGARYTEALRKDSVDVVRRVAENSQKILSKTYNNMRGKIASEVPENFVARPSDVVTTAYEDMLLSGLSQVQRKGQAITDADDIANVMKFFKESGRLPNNTKISLKSQADLKRQLKASGQFSGDMLAVADDPEAYKILSDLHGKLDLMASIKSTKGKDGALNLMEGKKQLNSVIQDLVDRSQENGYSTMANLAAGVKRSTDVSVTNAFEKVGLGNRYTSLQSTYSRLATDLQPLIKARKSAMGGAGQSAYETYLNKLSSRPGKGLAQKGSLTALAEASEKLGDRTGSKFFKTAQQTLEINDAAYAFNPYINKRGATAAGMGAFALFSANAPLALAVGTGAALGSPAVAKNVVRLNQVAWRGLKQLKTMSPKQINMLVENDNVSAAFINSFLDAQEIGGAVENKLQNMMPGASISNAP